MLKWKSIDTSNGKSWRLTLLRLFSVEIGIHEVNGTHFQLGFGIGPMETSLALHRWDKW